MRNAHTRQRNGGAHITYLDGSSCRDLRRQRPTVQRITDEVKRINRMNENNPIEYRMHSVSWIAATILLTTMRFIYCVRKCAERDFGVILLVLFSLLTKSVEWSIITSS